MKAIKIQIFFLIFMTAGFSAYASNPASTDYVDDQLAILRVEINQLLNGNGS